jgi:hypothetical protein
MAFIYLIELILYLVVGIVAMTIAMAFVSLCMAAWIVVILIGLVHPRLTVRQACDWFLELIRAGTAQVKSLDGR